MSKPISIPKFLRPLAIALLVVAASACAKPVEVLLPLPYRLVEDELIRQIYVGPDHTAQVLEGKNACNALTLYEPHVTYAPHGRIVLKTKVRAKSGSPLPAQQCLHLFSWTGQLVITEEVRTENLALKFHIVNSSMRAGDGKKTALPGVLWGWVKDNVHPRLQSLVIDLEPLRAASERVIAAAAPDARESAAAIVNSIQLREAVTEHDALKLKLAFEVPEPSAAWQAPLPSAPLTVEELERWRGVWQTWEGYATWLIKYFAHEQNAEIQRALVDALLDSRHELVTALTLDDGSDPVPQLFLNLWSRLTPIVGEIAQSAPGAEALNYLSFISVADMLQSVTSLAPQLGVRFDRDSLRQLVRLLAPAIDDAAWEYSTKVDPELRTLLGFDAEFPLSESNRATLPWWNAWISTAYAATTIDPALAQRLVGWVPQRDDLDTYLREVSRMFEQVETVEHARGKIPQQFVPVYDVLLRATAWEETCWRQFIEKSGRVQTLRSPSGAIGIMQVNAQVWRGVYDVNGLVNDPGYNARAGNEILVHYLVDYAIKQQEHTKGGSIDSLARATYAVYNGGPGHVARYRKSTTSKSLREIDDAFWRKYQAYKEQGLQAVKQCYVQ